MTRPTDDIEWGESSANVSNPSAARASGFGLKQIFTSAAANYMFRSTGRWVRWLRDGARLALTTLPAALAACSPGDVIEVAPDPSSSYLGRVEPIGASGDRVVALDTDGLYLWVVRRSASNVFAVEQLDAADGSLVRTLALSGVPDAANPVRAISSDGRHVGVAWGTSFEIYTVEDGTSRLTVNAGLTVSDVYMAGERALVLNATNGLAGGSVASYRLDDGTYASAGLRPLNASAAHGVTSDGRHVYLTYTHGTTGDFTLEALSWDLATLHQTVVLPATGAPAMRAIETDGQWLAVGTLDLNASARLWRLETDARDDSVELVEASLVDLTTAGYGVALVCGELLVSTSKGTGATLFGVDPVSGQTTWSVELDEDTVGENDVATDGLSAYVPGLASVSALQRVDLGRRVLAGRRCDGSERYRTIHNLFDPGR